MKKSLYELAGVPPAAPSPVIGMAIQRRLQKLQESGSPDAEAQAYALREAWSVLGDAKRRAAYDAKLAAELAKRPPAPAPKPDAKPGDKPAAAPVAKPAPEPRRIPTPEELAAVVIVEEAHPDSKWKTYAVVSSVFLVIAFGGLWFGLSGAKKATAVKAGEPAVRDNRSAQEKARSAVNAPPKTPSPVPAQ